MTPAKGQTTAAGAETRADLIRAARELLEKEGMAGMTFRAAAKTIGISHMAPYRHFADGPRELLAVIADEGFQEMISYLERSRAREPLERVVELALRYVQFGVERPHLYRALFHEQLADPLAFYANWGKAGAISPTSARHYQALDATKSTAFRLIVHVLEEAQAAGALGVGDPEDFGLALAALAHGLVGEFIDEGLYRRTSRQAPWSAERRRMSRRVLELLIAGFAH